MKDSKVSVVVVLLICLLATMGVVGYTTLSRIENNIAALEKKIGDMPQDLKDRIVANSSAVLGRVMDRVSNDHQKMADKCYSNIVANDMKLGENLIASHKKICDDESEKLKQMSASLANDATNVFSQLVNDSDKTFSSVVEIHNRVAELRKRKALDYLKVARSKEIDDVARGLLYRLAIQNSDDKAALLSEYAGVEDAAIQRLIQQKKLLDAEARASQLMRYFDTSIEQGSVDDVLAIGGLRTSLGNINKRLDEERAKEKQYAEEAVKEIELAVASTTNYEGCVALFKKLESLDDAKVSDSVKDPVRKVLTNKIACMTPVTEPIVLPEIDEETPWVKWLENFKHRLEDHTVSYDAKIKDVTTCADFLSQAHVVDDVSVSNLLAEIDVVVARENRKDWQTRAAEILSGGISKRPKKDAMRCVELLEEVGEFSEDNRAACSDEIVSLNKIVVSSALSEVYKQATYVRGLKEKIPQDEYVQLVSSLEGQCLQSLVRLQLLNSEFDGKFNDMISSVCAAVDGYSSIMSGIRKSKESAQDTVSRDREKKFVEWAKYMIDSAERTYNEGEKKAKEWFATTSNDYAQGRYKEAWKLIVRIKSGDLAASDELLFHRWQEVKGKIENRYKPTEADLKNGEYIGISDL